MTITLNVCQYPGSSQRGFCLGWATVAALFVVLGPTMARAADGVASYTATGHTLSLPYPGDTLAFAADNVQVRNLLSLLRVQSDDERLTGRRTVLMNGLSQPDGSQTVYGTWNGEVGTWILTDPQNPIFSATAGLWDGTWAGRLQPDGSYQIQRLRKRWAMTLLERVLAELRQEYAQAGHDRVFDELSGLLWGKDSSISYAQIGQRLGMSEGAVRGAMHRLRERYRERLRAEVAHTVADVREVDEELRYLIGVVGQSGQIETTEMGTDKVYGSGFRA